MRRALVRLFICRRLVSRGDAAQSEGAEVLLHVGIDTVALAGEGFVAHVPAGAQVSAGEPLLSFDMDLIARRARSLLTPVVVVPGRFSMRAARRVAHSRRAISS